ncbi:hypothetical protein D8Y04_13815 [Listeria seeligeri]|nr:hypothetical protein [Listeria seeligeri]MBM5696265.1 hypothetical protein [Listeria seeligeri]
MYNQKCNEMSDSCHERPKTAKIPRNKSSIYLVCNKEKQNEFICIQYTQFYTIFNSRDTKNSPLSEIKFK